MVSMNRKKIVTSPQHIESFINIIEKHDSLSDRMERVFNHIPVSHKQITSIRGFNKEWVPRMLENKNEQRYSDAIEAIDYAIINGGVNSIEELLAFYEIDDASANGIIDALHRVERAS